MNITISNLLSLVYMVVFLIPDCCLSGAGLPENWKIETEQRVKVVISVISKDGVQFKYTCLQSGKTNRFYMYGRIGNRGYAISHSVDGMIIVNPLRGELQRYPSVEAQWRVAIGKKGLNVYTDFSDLKKGGVSIRLKEILSKLVDLKVENNKKNNEIHYTGKTPNSGMEVKCVCKKIKGKTLPFSFTLTSKKAQRLLKVDWFRDRSLPPVARIVPQDINGFVSLSKNDKSYIPNLVKSNFIVAAIDAPLSRTKYSKVIPDLRKIDWLKLENKDKAAWENIFLWKCGDLTIGELLKMNNSTKAPRKPRAKK